MAGSSFQPETEIGVHPDERKKHQIDEHESQGAFGMFVHRCVSLCSASPVVARNARTQSSSVTIPTSVPCSTTGRQPILRSTSTCAASSIVKLGHAHTTSR